MYTASSTVYAGVYPGDLAQRINTAQLALPPEGGIIDATYPGGAQGITSGSIVLSKSNVRLLLPATGQGVITSTAAVVIQALANNIEVIGMGNSTVAVPDTGTTFQATGAQTFVQVGDTTKSLRNVRFVGIRFDGANKATMGLKYRSTAAHAIGYSKSERLEIVNMLGPCIDLTDGGDSQMEFEQIRCQQVNPGPGYAIYSTGPFHGQISFAHSLAQNVTGTGWSIGNAEFTCIDCDGEDSTLGFKFINGMVICQGCRSESSVTGAEISMSSSVASLVLTEWSSVGDTLPIRITSSNGSATLLNPITASTVGPNSILITGSLVGGKHLLINDGTLDKPILNQSAGYWKVIS